MDRRKLNAGIAGRGAWGKEYPCPVARKSRGASQLQITHHQSSIIHPWGFTLIELLVVISIVVLLVAILMPSLQRVRGQAKAAGCQANLRQWGIRGAAYAADYDGRLVDPFQRDSRRSLRIYHGYGNDPLFELLTYDANEPDRYSARGFKKLVLCPMATKILDFAENGGMSVGGTFTAWGYTGKVAAPCFVTPVPRPWYGSYGENGWVAPDNSGDDMPDGRTVLPKSWFWTNINDRNAASAPIILDATFWAPGTFREGESPPDHDAIPTGPSAANASPYLCMNRHDGGVNVLFLDWSAHKVGLKELWQLKWHKAYNTRGPWTKAGGVGPEDWPLWMRGFKEF
jgi:prepilin-type N-terminal cleavage/methylation domain-containing protein/prepilin-type processing-associated H-X9-DG protein